MFLDPLDAVQNALGVAVGRVDDDDVDTGVNELLDTFFRAAAAGDAGTDEQLAGGVLGSERVVSGLGDVLDGHEACEVEVVVNDENALEAVGVHEGLGFFEGGAFLDRDQAFTRGHDFGDRNGHAGFEAEVAVGDHAENLLAVNDRETGDVLFAGEGDDVADEHVGADGDRFGNNAGFMTLDLKDFSGLLVGGHVLVNEADAAFLSDGDGETGFRNRVHHGGNHRNVDTEITRQLRGELGIAGEDFGIGGDEKNVVEGESLLKDSHNNL